MSDKRAGFSLDEDIPIDKIFTPKRSTNTVSKAAIEKAAEQSGFVSREPIKRRGRRRTPYTIQNNFKTRKGMKELFQDLSERLDQYDQATFEMALLALIEKEGFDDLKQQYENLIKPA